MFIINRSHVGSSVAYDGTAVVLVASVAHSAVVIVAVDYFAVVIRVVISNDKMR